MKVVLAALILISATYCQICQADQVGRASVGRDPTLYFHADASDPAFGSVDLRNLASGLIERRIGTAPLVAQWHCWFAVWVDQTDLPASGMSPPGALPPVLGQYQILPDGVRFSPRFPPVQGLKYRASVNLSGLLGSLAPRRLTITFSLPPQDVIPSTVVDEVFPSGDVLPENLLRFYVHFTAPMQRGQARDHIVLLGLDGQPVPAALFNAPVELWDPAMQRLTVLLDPGRIKRGVGPNVELGPPLLQGSQYTLAIDAGMVDAVGHPLRERFAKAFRVAATIREAVDPRRWKVHPPASGTRHPLTLLFPAPLDRALLSRLVRVVDADDRPVTGDIVVDDNETRWAFIPVSDWESRPYRIEIDTSLEDVSGNSVAGALDVDARDDSKSHDSARQVSLPFIPCPDKELACKEGSNGKGAVTKWPSNSQ
jgi:hypothetical protein